MPELQRGSETHKDQSHKATPEPLHALHDKLNKVNAKVQDIEKHLEQEYARDALLDLSKQFLNISIEFNEFTRVKRHDFYDILTRSGERTADTRAVADAARKLARLFEKYAKKPKTYSASDSRFQISSLKAALKNLQAALPAIDS